jgi:hypothetical protein
VTSIATKLKQETAAVRLRHTKLGVRRALDAEQLQKAAHSLHADATLMSASKKVLDTSDPKYRAVTSVRMHATHYWRTSTYPFPEPGVRLIRRDRIEALELKLAQLHGELAVAVMELQAHYEAMKTEAKARLGELFNHDDYPAALDGQFALDWDYPSFDPPEYLKQISPKLYEQEQERIRARFEQAVGMAEEAFTGELAKLVSHLVDRLTGGVDGKPKVFRDTAVENLREFFERFGELKIGDNDQLDEVVGQARQILDGVDPAELRDNESLRAHVAASLADVKTAVDAMMIDRGKRAISLEEEGEGS